MTDAAPSRSAAAPLEQAFSTEFDAEDSLFLMSVANVIGDAIHRNSAEIEMRTRAHNERLT